MNFVIVDTDVVSFTFKRDTRHRLYRPHLQGKLLYISFMTLAELDFWAKKHNWGKQKCEELELFLQPYTVLESDRDLCRQWAAIKDQLQRCGSYLETADTWIAATALLYNVPLVTHNRSHFARVPGLQIISEAPL
jgi:predicted nucleic acid-binding protein